MDRKSVGYDYILEPKLGVNWIFFSIIWWYYVLKYLITVLQFVYIYMYLCMYLSKAIEYFPDTNRIKRIMCVLYVNTSREGEFLL